MKAATQSPAAWSETVLARGTLYIDGAWETASAGMAEIVDPATEEVVGRLALGDAADLGRAAECARAAFPAWSSQPPSARSAILDRVHALMLERKEALAAAISLEMGAAIGFARAAQIPLAAEHVRVARDLARDYPFQTVVDGMAIRREPIGVCGLITPWNWPLYQIAAKVGPALGAGCTMVLKPSELSPLSALLFTQLLHDAGVSPGVFNLVNGTGPEVGTALASHPEIDMVSITGSNRAGVLVAQAAAPTVKRVTQELGGKSPNILLPDVDVAEAVPRGVMAAFRNVGQSCSAPTRMIVPRALLAEVERVAAATAGAVVVGDPRSEATVLGPLANRAQFERVQAMIAAGLADGAKLVCGGAGRPEGLNRGFFARPTIFSEVTRDMRVAVEEIFGPVLSIQPYDTVDEAVELANATVYGLGAQVQSRDLEAARAVAGRIRAGQVHINAPAWRADAPFGGYKRSGNGREYGRHGFEEYLEIKAVLGWEPQAAA